MNMKYTKISGFILSLLMVPVTAFAESNVVAISPECSKVLSEVEAALEDAHANKDFLMITVNKKNPFNKDDLYCNVNFVVELKNQKDIESVREKFSAYMMRYSSFTLNNPRVGKYNE